MFLLIDGLSWLLECPLPFPYTKMYKAPSLSSKHPHKTAVMQGSHIAVLILELLICSYAAAQQISGRYPSKCKLPTEIGKCKGIFPRFYFDLHTRKCEKFVYGGCGGNANNFRNPVDCIWECERSDLLPEKCKLPLNKGVRGRKTTLRYFYDFKKKKCTMFFYNGFGGNRNNFLDIRQCIRECADVVYMPKRCKLPVVSGPCRAYIRRYFYNTKTNRCELFIYGGCMGNENNFTERINCIRQCQSYGPREDYDPKQRFP
nr:carboxypeptidase inhibitor SmCI-like [Podarcis muralis]